MDAETSNMSGLFGGSTYTTSTYKPLPVRVVVTPADDMRLHRETSARYAARLAAQNVRLAVSKTHLDAKIAKNVAAIAEIERKRADFATAIRTLEGPDALIDFVDPVTPVVVDPGDTYTPYTPSNDGAGA
jgi:hypothetical protein